MSPWCRRPCRLAAELRLAGCDLGGVGAGRKEARGELGRLVEDLLARGRGAGRLSAGSVRRPARSCLSAGRAGVLLSLLDDLLGLLEADLDRLVCRVVVRLDDGEIDDREDDH